MRIASNSIQNTLLKEMGINNSKLTTASMQVSTGERSAQLSDMAAQANNLLSFKDVSNTNQIYINNLATVNTRLQAAEDVLSSMEELLVDASQIQTLARTENSAETRATMAPEVEGLLNSFYSLMNTEFDDRYIFSGQDGGTSPLTGNPTATAYGGNPAATTYYQGDTNKASFISGAGQTDTYGVTGNHSAFASIKQGLESLWYGLENNSSTDIDGAITLLEQAQSQLSDLQGQVGGQISKFDLLSTRYTEAQTFVNERIDEIEQVDITEAMTEFTQIETALEASMLVISRLNSLSLMDFIS